MRRFFAPAAVSCLLFSVFAFSQGSNAQLGGIVTDPSSALLPGVTITVTNTETSVTNTTITNESGAYNFPSLQPGSAYRVSASLPGFQTKTVTNMNLGASTSSRQDFQLGLASTATTVEVLSEANSSITAAGASVGDVLPEYRIRNLPLVGNNVLELLNILPGLRISPIGEASSTIGGLGINSVNVTRDGLPLRDERFNPQGGVDLNGNPSFTPAYAGGLSLLSSTTINPDLVGEIRLILSPVDAELGRGNSQVQITTRSGTNKYTGSAVWNIQNSAMNANSWDRNNDIDSATGTWRPTRPDWRNTHQYTVSYGGPIFRNKTFFFVLWDQQITNTRSIQENRVLTDSARNGIFRYWEGWVADTANPSNNTTLPSLSANPAVAGVDATGKPQSPQFWPDSSSTAPKPYTGRLVCVSVFGNLKFDGSPFTAADCPSGTDVNGRAYTAVAMFPASGSLWDTKRPDATTAKSGYFSKILAKMPHANEFYSSANGDGLNYAAFRWLLGRNGNNNNESIVGSEAFSDRKQINIKIDQNFGAGGSGGSHRISAGWTYQRDDNLDNVGDWPDGLSGQTYRRPHTLTVNVTSTLSSSLLNEGRFGLNLNKTQSLPAWLSPNQKVRDEAQSYLLKGGTSRSGNGAIYPVVVAPTTANLIFNTGIMETTTGVTQVGYSNPLYNFADTLSWTRGKHAFKFGADIRLPRSDGFTLQPYPVVSYGNLGGTLTQSPFTDVANTPTLGTTGTPSATNAPQVANLFPQNARNLASELLYILTNSVGSITTPYWAENFADTSKGLNGWQDTTTQENRFRNTSSTDYAIFAKDDYKLTRTLTLNLGLRYEYYAPPFITSGLTSTTVDQGIGLFGVERGAGGKLFDNWLTPGSLYLTGYGNNASRLASGRTNFLECVSGVQQPGLPVSNCDPNLLTNIEFIGPNSPNTKKTIIPRDRNNFGPAIGFSWNVPWFGEGRTTIRGGYQATFSKPSIAEGTLASALGGFLNQGLGANTPAAQAIVAASGQNRAILVSDIPQLVPVTPLTAPGQTLPVYARSQSLSAYDPNYATPYTQNLTLSVTRSLTRLTTLDVRYVGTLARKQAGSLDLNTNTSMYNPELFDALERTRRGENVDLFDQMLAGLDLNTAAGYGPIGTCTAVAGAPGEGYCPAGTVRERGSEHLRRFSVGGTAGNLANGNFSGVVGTLIGLTAAQGGYYGVTGSTALPAGVTSLSLRSLRNGCDRIANGLYNASQPASQTNIPTRCFAENYLSANPQLNGATYNTNLGRSNYHALQVQFTLRPISGISFQTTYSWAKSMQLAGGGYTDPLMRDLDRVRGREGPHSLRSNGTFELPIGPNKLLFANTSGWVARVLERWQTSFILNLASGSPADILGAGTTRYGNARYVATQYWQIPKGRVEWNVNNHNSGSFYGDNIFVAGARDPQCNDASLVVQTDNRGYNFATNCNLTALALRVPQGSAGSYLLNPADPASSVVNVLVSPTPGKLGTLGGRTLDYWGQFNLDANIQKTFRLNESKQLSLRIDTTNVLNHPQVGIPNYFASGGVFGQFGAITGKSGNRTFQGQVRLSF